MIANDGEVTLYNVTVTDLLPDLSAIDCLPPQGSTLAPGETMAAPLITPSSKSTSMPAGWTTPRWSRVTASSMPMIPAPMTKNRDTEDLPQNPDIEIVKSSVPVSYSVAGQVIKYTFTATNTGNVTLYDVEPLTTRWWA